MLHDEQYYPNPTEFRPERFLLPDGTNLLPVLVLFWLGFIAGESALNINNAQLPSLAPPDRIGRISGSGAALGYWGGVAALILMLLFLADLRERHGSVEKYVREIGISTGQLAALREHLLTPA